MRRASTIPDTQKPYLNVSCWKIHFSFSAFWGERGETCAQLGKCVWSTVRGCFCYEFRVYFLMGDCV